MSQSPSKADFLARSIHTDTAVGRVIQTRYRGYKFRSRLEAKWCVLFEALGLEYEYEPEGYRVVGESYLPDFRVLSWDAWIECKPKADHDNAMTHLHKLSRVASITNTQHAIVVFGAPELMSGNYTAWFDLHDRSKKPCVSLGWRYFGAQGVVASVDPDEFVTLAYRKAMEERFESRA